MTDLQNEIENSLRVSVADICRAVDAVKQVAKTGAAQRSADVVLSGIFGIGREGHCPIGMQPGEGTVRVWHRLNS